jgi:predicted GIY-YIG superfamily endonuclease
LFLPRKCFNPFALSLSKRSLREGAGERMSFYVYMLQCVDRSYYVGHTDNLERRVAEHESGEIPGYTATWLMCSEEFTTREEALAAERRLKGWSWGKKEALIMGNWARVRVLRQDVPG